MTCSGASSPLPMSAGRSLASGAKVARNAVLNLLTVGYLLALLVVVMPKLVHGLGEERYGLFALAWAVIGYLSFFDAGIGQATIKYLAESWGKCDHEAGLALFRSSLVLNAAIGAVSCVGFAIAAPFLVEHVFKLPSKLRSEACRVFLAVGISVPVFLVQGAFRAALSSLQRFGSINLVNGISSLLQWAIAWLLVSRGFGVFAIVLAIVLMRVCSSLAYGGLVLGALPGLLTTCRLQASDFKRLLRFGGWVTIPQILATVLVYADRALIAFFLPLSSVTYYSVPFDSVSRISVLPSSITSTLFPAMSERQFSRDEKSIANFFWRPLRCLVFLLVPCIAVLVVMGPEILIHWMGREFASHSARVFQILAVGVLFNSLAYIPFSGIQAAGRPDLTAKLHMAEAPIYLALCAGLIVHWGIGGAAIAWTVRAIGDAVALLLISAVCLRTKLHNLFSPEFLRAMAVAAAFVTLLVAGLRQVPAFGLRLLWSAVLSGVYFAAIWLVVLDREERFTASSVLPSSLRIALGLRVQPESPNAD